MNKKKIFIIFICLSIVILGYICFFLSNKLNYVGFTKEYLHSSSLTNNEKSPQNIHVVLAKYDGNMNHITIAKQLYNIANNIIPYYANSLKRKSNLDLKYTFKFSKDNIYLNVGIDNLDDFKVLQKDISLLSGNLKLESYRIDKLTVRNIPGWIKFNMYIKYKDNDEVKLNVAIYNRYGKNNEVRIKVI